jgi:hypothetical protein
MISSSIFPVAASSVGSSDPITTRRVRPVRVTSAPNLAVAIKQPWTLPNHPSSSPIIGVSTTSSVITTTDPNLTFINSIAEFAPPLPDFFHFSLDDFIRFGRINSIPNEQSRIIRNMVWIKEFPSWDADRALFTPGCRRKKLGKLTPCLTELGIHPRTNSMLLVNRYKTERRILVEPVPSSACYKSQNSIVDHNKIPPSLSYRTNQSELASSLPHYENYTSSVSTTSARFSTAIAISDNMSINRLKVSSPGNILVRSCNNETLEGLE